MKNADAFRENPNENIDINYEVQEKTIGLKRLLNQNFHSQSQI